MAKQKNSCPPAKCTVVKGRRHCPIQVPIWGTAQCRPRREDEFDKRSLFAKKSGKATIIIGCEKGFYDAEKRRCRKGTRAVKMILPI